MEQIVETKSLRSECQICGEDTNKSTKKLVKCGFCEYEACIKCTKRYLLSESISKCMNCKKEWPRKFIRDSITAVFMNTELKTHYEDVLKQREIALLPEAQTEIENDRIVSGIMEEIARIQAESRIRLQELHDEMYVVREKRAKNKKTNFVRSCPEEDCRGFLNKAFRCGICDKYTCSQCHIVKGLERDVDHTCNPDNVATAILLAKDTKPCPTCGMGIFKISGCL